MECDGAAVRRSRGDLHGGIDDCAGCGEGRMRADCEECAGYSRLECEVEQDGHAADAVLQRFAAGHAGEGNAATVRRGKDGLMADLLCSDAALRTADTLLRANGGGAVLLRLPAPA